MVGEFVTNVKKPRNKWHFPTPSEGGPKHPPEMGPKIRGSGGFAQKIENSEFFFKFFLIRSKIFLQPDRIVSPSVQMFISCQKIQKKTHFTFLCDNVPLEGHHAFFYFFVKNPKNGSLKANLTVISASNFTFPYLNHFHVTLF